MQLLLASNSVLPQANSGCTPQWYAAAMLSHMCRRLRGEARVIAGVDGVVDKEALVLDVLMPPCGHAQTLDT